MGFLQHCTVARTADEDEAVPAVARTPPVLRAQQITAPFAGIVAAYPPGERVQHRCAAAVADVAWYAEF